MCGQPRAAAKSALKYGSAWCAGSAGTTSATQRSALLSRSQPRCLGPRLSFVLVPQEMLSNGQFGPPAIRGPNAAWTERRPPLRSGHYSAITSNTLMSAWHLQRELAGHRRQQVRQTVVWPQGCACWSIGRDLGKPDLATPCLQASQTKGVNSNGSCRVVPSGHPRLHERHPGEACRRFKAF
jgi:hypothetical protein